jgi:hypothetical protein
MRAFPVSRALLCLAVLLGVQLAPAHGSARPSVEKMPSRFASLLEATDAAELYDVIVVLRDRAAVAPLERALGRPLHRFRVLPMLRGFLTRSEIARLIRRPDVRFVEPNHRLQAANDQARLATGVEQVQTQLGFTGEDVHVAVIDTGVDATHPDLRDRVERHWLVTGPCPKTCFGEGDPLAIGPTAYVASSPSHSAVHVGVIDVSRDEGVGLVSDTYGHGTHVAGIIAGTGAASNGRLRGVAPGARLHIYGSAIGDQVLWALEAFDHVIAQVREGRADVRIISLSLSEPSGCAFEPFGASSVASRAAFEEGILPIWAYGNDGADDGTCSTAATPPYVLGVGATRGPGPIASFSSRGEPDANHDREDALANLDAFLAADDPTRQGWDHDARPLGLLRPGVVAPGVDVISTQGFAQVTNTNSLEANPYYGRGVGTSMATPHVAGVAALAIQAFEDAHPDERLEPLEIIRLLEVTADRDHLIGALAHEGGAGLVDAVEAVTLAQAGSIPAAVTEDHLLPKSHGPPAVQETFEGRSLPASAESNVGYTLIEIPIPDGVRRLDARILSGSASLRLYPPGHDPDAAFVFLERFDSGTNSVAVGAPWEGMWVLRVDDSGGAPFTGTWELRF